MLAAASEAAVLRDELSLHGPFGKELFGARVDNKLTLQVGGMTHHAGVQAAIFIDSAHLRGNDSCQAFIFVGELVQTDFVDQANVAVDPRR